MKNYREWGHLDGRVLLVASNNEHKVEEFRRILQPLGLRVASPVECGLRVDVHEIGSSFAENALLKARAFSSASGMPAVADDSGLAVDALNGEPGVYSARFGGPGLDDEGRYRLLLDRLSGVPESDRSARFITAITLSTPCGETLAVAGTVDGVIASEPRGRLGFGYDPVFYYPPSGKTFGEMTGAEKDAVSHRARALRALAATLSAGSAPGILR